jgi:hypothetical protein
MTARRFARPLLALSVLLTTGAILAGCESRSREPQTGSYRAVLEVQGQELPFGLEIAQQSGRYVLTLVNGEERVRVTDVSLADGQLTARLSKDGNTLSARVRGGTLEGEVSLQREDGTPEVLPFSAEFGQSWRFVETPLTDNADVSGRWTVTYTGDAGGTTTGRAELTQSFERVTGTVLAPTGEQRSVAGEVRGDELFLSGFDGVSADLYRARLDADGNLAGDHWSGTRGHERFRALPAGAHHPHDAASRKATS